MLVKNLKANPAILFFFLFCVYFGWHLSFGQSQGDTPGETAPPQEEQKPVRPAPVPAPMKQASQDPPNGKTKPRIALVTFVTEQRSYLHLSLKNKSHYTRRHNHTLITDFSHNSPFGPTWYKYNMMERLIRGGQFDWLWWLDFDTLITNTDVDVADIIHETLNNLEQERRASDIDFLVTHDCNNLNTGSFIVRSHERSVDFLEAMFAMKRKEALKETEHHMSEQDAMRELIAQNADSARRTVQVPQWKLNAFPKEIACFDESDRVWEPGMFVLHFAGAWAHVKGDDPTGQLMEKYKGDIIWGEEEELD